jgi:hypothetical protein
MASPISTKVFANMFARYILLITLGLGNLSFWYFWLTPLTVQTLATLLRWTGQEVSTALIFIQLPNSTIALVPACIAGSAFYLMTILVLATPFSSIRKQILVLITLLASLFALNLIRLFFLVSIIDKPLFGPLHWFLWNILSIILVVLLWMGATRGFHINEIPGYSDAKTAAAFLKNPRQNSKRKKSHKNS